MFGWRIGFLAAGLLAFACAILAASLSGLADHDHDHDHDHDLPTLLAPVRPPRPSLARNLRAFGLALLGFWQDRALRWLFVALIAAGFVYRGFLTFLSLHLAEGGGSGYASYAMSAVLVAGIFAQRFGGELADRRPRERLFLVLASLMPPLMLALAFARGTTALAVALACGFVWALAQPVANALTATYARSADHGLLYGIQFAITFGVGSFATTAGGVFLQASGTRLVFIALAGAAIVQVGAAAAVVAIAAPRPLSTGPSMGRKAPPTRDDDGSNRASGARPSVGSV
jgi:MFS family permease